MRHQIGPTSSSRHEVVVRPSSPTPGPPSPMSGYVPSTGPIAAESGTYDVVGPLSDMAGTPQTAFVCHAHHRLRGRTHQRPTAMAHNP
jgi:hypothetical protein